MPWDRLWEAWHAVIAESGEARLLGRDPPRPLATLEPALHAEISRANIAQDWTLAQPLVKNAAKRKAYAEAATLLDEALPSRLRLDRGARWEPREELLVQRALAYYGEEGSAKLATLLGCWQETPRAQGQLDLAAALTLQIVALREAEDGEAMLEAFHALASQFHAMTVSRSLHVPMTIEDFHLMPWELGWKHEYFDGMAHVTPSMVCVDCVLEVGPMPAFAEECIRPVGPSWMAALVEGFGDAFQGSAEYSGWPQDAFDESVRDSIEGHFSGKYGAPSPASQAAFSGRDLIGAALVVVRRDRHCLQPLFVKPPWQRKGVATLLASAVVDALHGMGEKRLFSSFLLANESSRCWHRQFGFRELPSELLTRHCLHHCRHELWRRQQRGELTAGDRERLTAERQRLEAQLLAMEHQAVAREG